MIAPAPGSAGRRPLVVTMGEPAGIGGEITLKAWLRRGEGVPLFCVIDDADRLAELSRRFDWDVPVRVVDRAGAAADAFSRALPVLHRPLPWPVAAGRPDPANAPAVIAAVETAVGAVMAGDAAAVVTNPIHKRTLHRGGFAYPGHTELLAALAGGGASPVMMLVGADLRVVPVTIHVSLRQAVETLSTAAIVEAARITAKALAMDFGIRAPRLAVAGLNPHAGEEGDLGWEDEEIVAPAVAELRRQGIDASGPLAADTLFAREVRRGYDCAICMYHDQALIPLKALDFAGGVNVTLGLPFVRTSPDHGTAFDIAGRGSAGEVSLVAAMRLAAAIAGRRTATAPG
jgi:4-hydroxythreonine-4-phosphate dehydrogenase